MATIKEIVIKRSGRAGAGRAWQVTTQGPNVWQLTHHGTVMLVWRDKVSTRQTGKGVKVVSLLAWSTGMGSKSDQNGLNVALEALELEYYFARDRKGGGARLVKKEDGLVY